VERVDGRRCEQCGAPIAEERDRRTLYLARCQRYASAARTPAAALLVVAVEARSENEPCSWQWSTQAQTSDLPDRDPLDQRRTTPVLAGVGEQPVLESVPL